MKLKFTKCAFAQDKSNFKGYKIQNKEYYLSLYEYSSYENLKHTTVEPR